MGPDPERAGNRFVAHLTDAGFSRVPVPDLVLWYAVSASLVYALPTLLRSGSGPWNRPAAEEIQAWYWAFGFVVGAVGVMVARSTRARPSLPLLALLATGPWVLGYLALLLRPDIPHSRVIALMSAVGGNVLLFLPPLVSPLVIRLMPRVTVVLAGLAAVASSPVERPDAGASTSTVSTSFVPLSLTWEDDLVADTMVSGGAIVKTGSGLLLVTGSGAWYNVMQDSAGGHLRVRKLSIPSPMKRDGFTFDARLPRPIIRVTGVAVDSSPAGVTVYVAHEMWRPDERCTVMQVSAMRMARLEAPDSVWRPIYATKPCLKPDISFDPWESGGRLLLQPDHSLLLTVGDYGENTVAATALSQLSDTDYGKTLRIGPDGSRTLHSLGHRNPTGIVRDRDGRVWVAEHGPRGGDEINLIEQGRNYGWPLATYGTEYGSYRWRFPPPAQEAGFTEPSFVLVPSVGISSLIAVQGRLFEPWAGDLLAGSLSAKQLLRFRVEGTRVIYAEPIPVNRRIRDLVETDDGNIVLWTDGRDLGLLSPEPSMA